MIAPSSRTALAALASPTRMRPFVPLIATVLASVPALGQTPTAANAPCTTPTAACTRWVVFGAGPARSMVYATHPLDVPNPAITRALVMVHGAARNPDHYFVTTTGAGFLAGALDHTIIVAPRFGAGNDPLAPGELLWPERGDSWRSGGMSPANAAISSFDVMDELLRRLANKATFPNLTQIVVAGHSAGGQYVARYAMANKVHGTLGVGVRYVVANPSSYAWPTAVRPLPVGDADPTTVVDEALGSAGETVHTRFTYGPFDAAQAPGFNRWPAGLERRSGYTAQTSDDELRKHLAERPTTYLLGQVDVLPLGGFDASPNAMAQGPTRRARGEAFVKYIREALGAKPEAIIVPECGHNDRCMFTADAALPVIFPP